MEQYPAKRYHASKAPVYVNSADEDAALGPDWGSANVNATTERLRSAPVKAPKSKE